MTPDLLSLALLAALLWQAHVHAVERRALIERLTGTPLLPSKPEPGRRRFGSDEAEWEVEQRRNERGMKRA